MNLHADESPAGVSPERQIAILAILEETGLIEDETANLHTRYIDFQINAGVVLVARKIEAAEREKDSPKDVVAQVNKMVRETRIGAWLIIGSVVLAAVLTIIGQTLSILKTLGALP